MQSMLGGPYEGPQLQRGNEQRRTLEASLREGSPSLLTSSDMRAASASGLARSSSAAAASARSFTYSRLSRLPSSRAATNAEYLPRHERPSSLCH